MQELIKVYGKVLFTAGPTRCANPTPISYVSALNAELSAFGYTLDGPLFTALSKLEQSKFNGVRDTLRASVIAVTGADARTSNVLFTKFPYDTPDQHKYLRDRIVAHMRNHLGRKPNDMTQLSCGHMIDNNQFDLTEFGACPICQEQVDELDSPENVKHDFQSITPLKVLRLAGENYIAETLGDLFGRAQSLTPDEKTILLKLSQTKGLDVERPTSVYRENLPYVHAYFGDLSYTSTLLSGATDILRIASFMSNPEADLSLTENVKFKLTTSQKKQMLGLLELRPSLEEDFMRHRERWLRLGERLNPNSAENSKRFPKTAKAFDTLRNKPQTIETFNRSIETKIRTLDVDDALLSKLASRPGEFMRKLDFLLRTAESESRTPVTFGHVTLDSKVTGVWGVLNKLPGVVKSVPLRLLFDIRKHLMYRAKGDAAPRLFFPAGSVTKLQIVDDRRKPISVETIAEALAIIDSEIRSRMEATAIKQNWAPVNATVDDNLQRVLLPFNSRGASSTSIPVTKGSAYPILDDAQVIRMFLYWKASTDLDLSLLALDDQFNFVEQISFTNTKGSGAVHSGDIQNASSGASEYIDFEIDTFRQRGIRYVAMTVFSYRGAPFGSLEECFAGYMERDALRSGLRYEPKSIALKFDIKSRNTNHTPLLFDLEKREMIFADISGSRSSGNSLMHETDKYSVQTRALMSLPERKVSAYDVMQFVADVCHDPSAAEVTFSRSNINALDALKLIEE